MRPLALAALLSLSACGGPATQRVPLPEPPPEAAPLPAPSAPPRFVEDDLDAALEEARRSSKLLLVDGWAPWCHTCLSMLAKT